MNTTSKQASLAINHAQLLSSDSPSTTGAQLVQQGMSPACTQSQLTMSDIQSPSSDTSSTPDAQLTQQVVSPAHTQPQLTTTDIQSPSSNITSATNAQTQCILFRLAPELRDIIYEHVFGTGVIEGFIQVKDSLDLTPQSALTVTCRRIHEEATPLHQIPTTTYWTANVFRYTRSVDMNRPVLTTKRIKHLTCIILHNDFDDWHLEDDLCPAPVGYILDLAYRPDTSARAPVGTMTYQCVETVQGQGKWCLRTTNDHPSDDCEGDDICNVQGTFYRQGSLGKGKFDARAKLSGHSRESGYQISMEGI
jgi:hypothetical protein